MIEPPQKKGSLSEKAAAAFEQAARKVVERARQTGTPVVVWEDDQVKEIPPEKFTEYGPQKLKTGGVNDGVSVL
jgi:hypothetical protein